MENGDFASRDFGRGYKLPVFSKTFNKIIRFLHRITYFRCSSDHSVALLVLRSVSATRFRIGWGSQRHVTTRALKHHSPWTESRPTTIQSFGLLPFTSIIIVTPMYFTFRSMIVTNTQNCLPSGWDATTFIAWPPTEKSKTTYVWDFQ